MATKPPSRAKQRQEAQRRMRLCDPRLTNELANAFVLLEQLLGDQHSDAVETLCVGVRESVERNEPDGSETVRWVELRQSNLKDAIACVARVRQALEINTQPSSFGGSYEPPRAAGQRLSAAKDALLEHVNNELHGVWFRVHPGVLPSNSVGKFPRALRTRIERMALEGNVDIPRFCTELSQALVRVPAAAVDVLREFQVEHLVKRADRKLVADVKAGLVRATKSRNVEALTSPQRLCVTFLRALGVPEKKAHHLFDYRAMRQKRRPRASRKSSTKSP